MSTIPVFEDEIVHFLQTLIRFNTSNPPGNETPAAEWIADVLRNEGLEPVALESAPMRGNVVTRLKGTGEEAPLLLMSHIDVVPVEEDKWIHPPFGGEIHDGYIWGRGALDMKGIVAQHLMLMVLFARLARQGIRLKRDLIMMAAADEERAGTFGALWLVEHHPDLIRAEYALNEGGGNTTKVGDALLMNIQTAEKGLARFKMTVRGEPGHASIPKSDNTVVRLAEAVVAVGKAQPPAHITPTAKAYIEAMAGTQPATVAELMLKVVEPGADVAAAIEALPLEENHKRYLYAITHNTAAPTIVNAGSKINVFPSEAVARVDGRTLPGFGIAEFRAEYEPFLPDGVEIEFEDDGPALEASLESPLYDSIVKAVQTHAPDSVLVPTLLTGATDAKAIVQLGTKIYGFAPSRYEAAVDGERLVHGHNERISIANLVYGAQVLYDVVWDFCGQHSGE
jgi:acetylornithine deacetylase/succinyl-diaminopimelate desuccinylase-like protein